jgi:hypothetical protein
MSNKPTKSWKDLLLSSGVPLEHSIEELLKKLNLLQVSEYKYVRPNETGVPTVFSVDIHATDIDTDRDVWLDLFVECKYRHPGTRWAFCPEQYQPFFGPTFHDTFITLDCLTNGREFSAKVLAEYAAKFQLCERGIELLPAESNPKTLRQGIEQLRYAAIDKSVDVLSHQASYRTSGTEIDPAYLIIPVLVTTAELWRIRDDATIASIQEADDLPDVATRHDVIVYREPPDNLATKYASDRILAEVQDEEAETAERLAEAAGFDSWDMFIEIFTRRFPSQFIVVNHTSFESTIREFLSMFARSDLVTARSVRQEAATTDG